MLGVCVLVTDIVGEADTVGALDRLGLEELETEMVPVLETDAPLVADTDIDGVFETEAGFEEDGDKLRE